MEKKSGISADKQEFVPEGRNCGSQLSGGESCGCKPEEMYGREIKAEYIEGSVFFVY